MQTHKAVMEVQQVLHMNGGVGETSYYKNSLYQKHIIRMAKLLVEDSIAKLCLTSLPECLKAVDMGCSSGPNTLLPLEEIIEAMDSTCSRLNKKPPMLQFFLNDLPGNDFNTVFRSLLPNFYDKLEKKWGGRLSPCFIAAMPGNFFGRLFPDNSVHFVHSSYSLHFISKVPEGLVSESGIPLNKGNICVSKTSPGAVNQAYLDQFQRDFTAFLESRSKEMISGGGMVLTVMGQSDNNPFCKHGGEFFHLIAISLNEMVQEGLIQESLLDAYNIPLYCPSEAEVRDLIQKEGSFAIARIEQFETIWDVNMEDGDKDLVFDKWEKGKYVATFMRAVTESMLASHFGEAIIDDLFHRLSIKVADMLEKGIAVSNNLAISLVKK